MSNGLVQIRNGNVLIKNGKVRTCNCCGSTGCSCAAFSSVCVTGSIALSYAVKQRSRGTDPRDGCIYTTVLTAPSLTLSPVASLGVQRALYGYAVNAIGPGVTTCVGTVGSTVNATGSVFLCPTTTYCEADISANFGADRPTFTIFLTSFPLLFDVDGNPSYQLGSVYGTLGLPANTNCYSSNDSATLYGIQYQGIASPPYSIPQAVTGSLSWLVSPSNDCGTSIPCIAVYNSSLICDSTSTAHWSNPVLASYRHGNPGVVTNTWTGGGCTRTFVIVDAGCPDSPPYPSPEFPPSPTTNTIADCCAKCYGLYSTMPTDCDGHWTTPTLVQKGSTLPVQPLNTWYSTSKEPCTFFIWISDISSGQDCATFNFTPPSAPTNAPAGCCVYYFYPGCSGVSFDTNNAIGTVSKAVYDTQKTILGFNDGDVLLTTGNECIVVDISTSAPSATETNTATPLNLAQLTYSYSITCGTNGYSGSGVMAYAGSCTWLYSDDYGNDALIQYYGTNDYGVSIDNPDYIGFISSFEIGGDSDFIPADGNGCPTPGTYTIFCSLRSGRGTLTIGWA